MDIVKPLNELLKNYTKGHHSALQLFSTLSKHSLMNVYFYMEYMEKPYTLFTDSSHYAQAGVLTQTVDSPEDLRPIVYTSGSFFNMQQKWSANEKEAFAAHQSVIKFDLYLRGEECILHCNHKLLEPFLFKDIKIPKLNRCSMELADYNIILITLRVKTMS